MTPPAPETFVDVSDEDVLATFTDALLPRTTREQAFNELLTRYERRVHAICYRQLGNRERAEEAAQDTFLHLARRAEQFRGDAQLSTFVYRIAVNASRDLARRHARRPQTPVADIARAQAQAGIEPETVEDAASELETSQRVQDALDQLDETSRTLIILCSIEGMSYPEASEVLEMPVGTIKSRVFRARAQLAEILRPVAPVQPHAPSRRHTERTDETQQSPGRAGDRPGPRS